MLQLMPGDRASASFRRRLVAQPCRESQQRAVIGVWPPLRTVPSRCPQARRGRLTDRGDPRCPRAPYQFRQAFTRPRRVNAATSPASRERSASAGSCAIDDAPLDGLLGLDCAEVRAAQVKQPLVASIEPSRRSTPASPVLAISKPASRAAFAVASPTACTGRPRSICNPSPAWRTALALVSSSASNAARLRGTSHATGSISNKGTATASSPIASARSTVSLAPGSGRRTNSRRIRSANSFRIDFGRACQQLSRAAWRACRSRRNRTPRGPRSSPCRPR